MDRGVEARIKYNGEAEGHTENMQEGTSRWRKNPELKERQREYKKMYRLQNKEKIKLYYKMYQAKIPSKERRKINYVRKRGM